MGAKRTWRIGENMNHGWHGLARMLGYRNITGFKTVLLLNFKHASLRFKRVFNWNLKSFSSVPLRVIRG